MRPVPESVSVRVKITYSHCGGDGMKYHTIIINSYNHYMIRLQSKVSLAFATNNRVKLGRSIVLLSWLYSELYVQ